MTKDLATDLHQKRIKAEEALASIINHDDASLDDIEAVLDHLDGFIADTFQKATVRRGEEFYDLEE